MSFYQHRTFWIVLMLIGAAGIIVAGVVLG